MYLLSLRLAPSPWVGTRFSGTAQNTVPSVSTQTVTPRRVGFLTCSRAPPRAEPAGPSVWCTMMFFHGWAFDSSPHGASQTTLRPGISGVPGTRAMLPRPGVCADAGARSARTPSAIASRRKFMTRHLARSGVLAQGLLECHVVAGRQRRRRVVLRVAVLAVILGGVKRVVGGGDQPVRERADLAAPLRDADRDRDRDIGADAGLGVVAADIEHPARDHRALAQCRGRQHDAEFVTAGARQHVAGPQPGLR